MKKKIALTVMCVAILVSVWAFQLDLKIDGKADQHLTDVLKRSGITFGIARGINGAISVLQGTDVSLSPAGIGLKIAIGEVLDPVNDMVELFSNIMFWSSVSLGAQKFLLKLSGWIGVRILFSFVIGIAAVSIWYSPQRFDLRSFAARMFLSVVLVRFFIPMVALMSESAYHIALKDSYSSSVSSLEHMSDEIKSPDLLGNDQRQSSGWMDRAKEWVQDSKYLLELKQKIAIIKSMVTDFTLHVVNLSAIFIIQSIAIPLAVLAALAYLGKSYLQSINPFRIRFSREQSA